MQDDERMQLIKKKGITGKKGQGLWNVSVFELLSSVERYVCEL